MVATVGDPADPVFIHTSKICGVELTSSYEEEKVALHLTFDWTRANCPAEVLGNYCPEESPSTSISVRNLAVISVHQHYRHKPPGNPSPLFCQFNNSSDIF